MRLVLNSEALGVEVPASEALVSLLIKTLLTINKAKLDPESDHLGILCFHEEQDGYKANIRIDYQAKAEGVNN